jgi:hypothetical protein
LGYIRTMSRRPSSLAGGSSFITLPREAAAVSGAS